MRILYAAHKYDYGKKERGNSFEHFNFFDPLHQMGHEILYFDLRHLEKEPDRSRLNTRLEEIARAEKPDLLFSAPFAEEMDKKTIRRISKLIPTVAWFCDDHWKFDTYTHDWAPCFNWSVTTAASAMPKYEKIRYDHVIKSQWAANHYLYRKLDLPLKFDVTFVGQPHGTRRAIVDHLREAGIDVQTFGNGWENGRVSQDQMVEIFNQSRINLNLSNSFISVAPRRRTFARRVRGKLARLTGAVPIVGSMLGSMGPSALKNAQPVASPDQEGKKTGPLVWDSSLDQIKGRNFEVPGCGGFTLTGAPENLGDYFRLGQEVVTFADAGQLVERMKYYLANERERSDIADAGHRRTLAEHTYVHRFSEIFRRMGLPHESAETILSRSTVPGPVTNLLPE